VADVLSGLARILQEVFRYQSSRRDLVFSLPVKALP